MVVMIRIVTTVDYSMTVMIMMMSPPWWYVAMFKVMMMMVMVMVVVVVMVMMMMMMIKTEGLKIINIMQIIIWSGSTDWNTIKLLAIFIQIVWLYNFLKYIILFWY